MKKTDFLALTPQRQTQWITNAIVWFVEQQAQHHDQLGDRYSQTALLYFRESVRLLVIQALAEGEKITQEDVAIRLRISAPTLRRYMAACGTSYQQIVDEQRMAIIEPLVEQGLPPKHIAIVSGLNSVPALYRWWRHQTGQSFRFARKDRRL